MKKYAKYLSAFIWAVFIVVLASCGSDSAETEPGQNAISQNTGTASECSETDAAHDIEGAMIFNHHYNILRVSDRPLFRSCGRVNGDVLENLMAILDDPRLDPMMREVKAEWPTGMTFEDTLYTAITAADFSNFVVPEPGGMSDSGAIVIKLFETIPERTGVQYGHVTEFTSQWWQLVYRSTDAGNDVLTLWMMQPYRLTPFSGTRYDTLIGRDDERFINRQGDQTWSRLSASGVNTILSDERKAANLPACDTYFFEGNFSASIARSNLLRDLAHLLNYFDIERYLVAPIDIPGQWQSSRYQTGSNTNMRFYASGEFYVYREDSPGSTHPNGGLGASGLIWGRHFHFSLINGKDGLSIGPYYNHWPHTILTPTHDDLLWLPSDFEVRSMGHSKDNALFQTFITDPDDPASELRWNFNNTAEEDWRYGRDVTAGRSGLWRLNGFDRAFVSDALGLERGWESQLVWLRSTDVLGMGNANTVYHTGNRYGYGVNQLAGMRPAVHLSLARLLQGN